jgi:serine/threonine-protein kinase RsbW
MPLRQSRNMEREQLTLDSTLESVDEAENIVIREAQKAGFEEDDQQQIGMAVRECMVNAVVHGNRYNNKKKVHLELEPSETGLTIVIGDEGEGFDLDSLPDPLSPENLMRQSGRGLLLVRAFMDEFHVQPREGGGTEVRLTKKFTK